MSRFEDPERNPVTDPAIFPPSTNEGPTRSSDVTNTRDEEAASDDKNGKQKVYKSASPVFPVVLGLIVALAVIIFLAQNTQSVDVKFLWLEGSASLAIIVLVVAFAAIVVDELIGFILRHRHRKIRNQKEELEALRNKRG